MLEMGIDPDSETVRPVSGNKAWRDSAGIVVLATVSSYKDGNIVLGRLPGEAAHAMQNRCAIPPFSRTSAV